MDGKNVAVNISGLRENASSLLKAQENLGIKLERILNLKNQVTWTGVDSDAAMAKFQAIITELGKVATAVGQYGKFLNAAADSMAESQSAVKSVFEA